MCGGRLDLNKQELPNNTPSEKHLYCFWKTLSTFKKITTSKQHRFETLVTGTCLKGGVSTPCFHLPPTGKNEQKYIILENPTGRSNTHSVQKSSKLTQITAFNMWTKNNIRRTPANQISFVSRCFNATYFGEKGQTTQTNS